MPKFITFREAGTSDCHPTFNFFNQKTGHMLGAISWHRPWRKYFAHFNVRAVLSHDDLADISQYLKILNAKNAKQPG